MSHCLCIHMMNTGRLVIFVTNLMESRMYMCCSCTTHGPARSYFRPEKEDVLGVISVNPLHNYSTQEP